jgi:hypothetical protein
MSRCQNCKEVTHFEHLNVYVSTEDYETVLELEDNPNWTPVYNFANLYEFGKLKVGDIVIHFIHNKILDCKLPKEYND